MTTFTIPLTTLPVGTIHLGPSDVADTEQLITLTVDRTVTGGLNSLTSSSVLAVTVDQSGNGGTTWQTIAGCTWAGGIILNPPRTGNPFTSVELQTSLLAGTSPQLRATVTVTGSAIAVAGTLVTS